jgi:hypothetical protein
VKYSSIPDGNPYQDWQSTVCGKISGYEPRTAGLQFGVTTNAIFKTAYGILQGVGGLVIMKTRGKILVPVSLSRTIFFFNSLLHPQRDTSSKNKYEWTIEDKST